MTKGLENNEEAIILYKELTDEQQIILLSTVQALLAAQEQASVLPE